MLCWPTFWNVLERGAEKDIVIVVVVIGPGGQTVQGPLTGCIGSRRGGGGFGCLVAWLLGTRPIRRGGHPEAGRLELMGGLVGAFDGFWVIGEPVTAATGVSCTQYCCVKGSEGFITKKSPMMGGRMETPLLLRLFAFCSLLVRSAATNERWEEVLESQKV